MSRDYRRLEVFRLADQLALDVYRTAADFPAWERYGLQAQIRRAAVSVAANIVEGCQRPTTRDYLRFLALSLGSAAEARYLINLASRLGFVTEGDRFKLEDGYDHLVRSLENLLRKLSATLTQ